MADPASDLQSKRAREFVVRGEDTGDDQPAPMGRAAEKVQAVVNLRDSFDSQATKVGLRDSTWVIIGLAVVVTVILNWGNPEGINLFSRLLLVGGGLAILVAVGCRRFLED